MGGTELMLKRIHETLPSDLMDQVQLIPSRVRELDATKVRILYNQDLADDPEAQKALSNRGWTRFHKIVFASNWQMQNFIQRYQIPWSHCLVIPNAIHPITPEKFDTGRIKFIYHSTPHRGLNLLYAVFLELLKKHPDKLHLDVYSSFKLYGWEQRDEQFKDLFEKIEAHPDMTNHGTVSNDEIRAALAKADIFAYPNTWTETSCISLIEAMSAGCLCIHPNLGALFETSGNWTTQYQFNEDPNVHASWFYQIVDNALTNWGNDNQKAQIANQKSYADVFHNWNHRAPQWEALIRSLLNEPRELPKEMFVYNA